MIKVGICGATGYSGRELIEILLRHPEAEIVFLTSKQYVGLSIADVFPQFRNRFDMTCVALDVAALSKDVDVVFLSLPHTVSMTVAESFLSCGVGVIDLSGDYRLKDEKLYKKWYGKDHQDKGNLDRAIYGLSEFFEEQIKEAKIIANPGCYPTGAILAVAPALGRGLIDPELIIDAKSGVSGAGRGLSLKTHFVEVHENMGAYKVGSHQHMPEIAWVLSEIAGNDTTLDFTPHLIPVKRGILTTAYGKVKEGVTEKNIFEAYIEAYANKPFIRHLLQGQYPQTADVFGTNFCDIALFYNPQTGRLVMMSAIDNLVKGASGQAVQNMNIMQGFPQEMGLL